MTSRGLEIRVGAVVTLAAILLVVGTMWFQRFQGAERRYKFYARFDDVGGLVAGNAVFVNGVESGSVKRIDLENDRVVVELSVREEVKLPVDSHITLPAVGIMGDRQVTIVRGKSTTNVASGDTLNGELLMDLGAVMGKAGDMIGDVEATIKNLRELSETLNADGKLRAGVNDFAATGKTLREMTEENRENFNKSLASLESSATQLDRLLKAHYADVDSTLSAVGRASGQINTTADHLAAISENLKHISANLSAGKGSAGRLLTDDTLVIRLESATASLDSLLKDMREHPGRYVKFSLF